LRSHIMCAEIRVRGNHAAMLTLRSLPLSDTEPKSVFDDDRRII